MDRTYQPIFRISIVEVDMKTEQKWKIPWPLLPFSALWNLICGIVEFTGRLVAVLVGLVLLIIGIVVSLTIVGAIIGVPLAIIGLLLTMRGIF